MRIKLIDNVRGTLSSVANYTSPGKMYLIIMGAISKMGLEMDVSTNYLFKDSFNGSIPQHKHEELCRYIIDVHLPNHRSSGLVSESEVKKYIKETSLFHVKLGLVQRIINDQRPLYMRCLLTGELVPTSTIPNDADKSTLEDVDYAPKNARIWRLENMQSGERLAITDDELNLKFNLTPFELLQSINYTGENTEWRLNDSNEELARA